MAEPPPDDGDPAGSAGAPTDREPPDATGGHDGADGGAATGVTDAALLRAVLGMAPRAAPPALLEGTVIADAYRVVRRLGAGGMGVVYLARDLRLGRDVAIKLHAAGGSTAGVERLVREASAIAQLGHANVVTVFQIGSHDGRPFVAMEYVDGGTARGWLAARRRGWREIVALYLAAGRGLAAAHRAGLVHRDFKPDNVLVGDDGRVRVADFGLVQGALPSASGDDGAGEAVAGGAVTLTRTGAVLGTPAYMAPEQHRGAAVGAAADQFAFCVALWEALFGARPFAGASGDEIAAAIARGRPAARASPRGLPGGVRRALERGLAADPAARFPALDALLARLERARGAGRRRLVAGAAAAAVIVGGLGTWIVIGGGDAAAARCGDAPARLAGVWDDGRRAAVHDAFVATGRPHAAETFARTAAALDRYAGAWVSARIDTCRATHARHEQSAQLMDLRYHCLDRRRAALGALVTLFATGPDPQVLDQAVSASLELDPLADCDDVPALTGGVARPTAPAARAAAERLEAAAVEAKVRLDAGKYKEGVALLAAAVGAAGATPHPPAHAEALTVLAQLQSAAGDHAAAKATARAAARAAGEAHDDRQVAGVWIFLLQVLASRTGELDEAEALVPVIETALARAGRRPLQQATYDNALGALRQAQGRYADARVALERALATAEREVGGDHPMVANTLNRLANAVARLGELGPARHYLERAIALQRTLLGAEHPHLAMSLHNLGGVLQRAGSYDDALAVYGQALAMKERLLGADHRDLASTASALGSTLRQVGRYPEAIGHLERAVAISEAAFGGEHPSMARHLISLAGAMSGAGRRRDALPIFERGLALLERARGPAHPDVASTLLELAELRANLDDLAGSRRDATRARAILEASVGPAHADVGAAIGILGDLLVHEGKPDQALREYDRALAIVLAARGETHPQVARARHAIGLAHVARGDERSARAALEQARAGFAAALGAEHPEVARCQLALARLDLAAGDAASARGRLEPAVVALDRAYGAGSTELAEARFVLAQARWSMGSDRAAALAEARAARAALAQAGAGAAVLAPLDAWLRRPRAP